MITDRIGLHSVLLPLLIIIIIIIMKKKFLLTTKLPIKILITINSLEKKKKNYSFKTLFTISVDLTST